MPRKRSGARLKRDFDDYKYAQKKSSGPIYVGFKKEFNALKSCKSNSSYTRSASPPKKREVRPKTSEVTPAQKQSLIPFYRQPTGRNSPGSQESGDDLGKVSIHEL